MRSQSYLSLHIRRNDRFESRNYDLTPQFVPMLTLIRRLCGGSRSKKKSELEEKQSQPNVIGTTDSTKAKIAYQPLHPSVRSLMDPEYVAFHDKYVQYIEPEHLKPFNHSIRTRVTWPYAGSPIVEVGRVRDIRPCPNFTIRVFTPAGNAPSTGWPSMLWLHGGGFVSGNIDSDNDICSLLCREVECVVANIDYRLAPEHPYPAAVDDVREVLKWVSSEAGATQLGTNKSKVAIGGSSAGANLAAVGALLAVEMCIPLVFQALVVPVIDNAATLDTIWASHPHAPWLTAPRMTWYRNLYLEGTVPRREWEISPLLAPNELLPRLPKTWFGIAGQDMLSTEGLAYADLLKDAGVDTDIRIYAGMSHSMMSLSGVLTKARESLLDLVEAVRVAFQ